MNMLQHYIKIALRNLLKYKQQSIISIVGLAIGVSSFAFCSYTMRVKMAWDTNIKEVDRICLLYSETEQGADICYDHYAPQALAKDFPEIESYTAYSEFRPYTEKLCEVVSAEGSNNYHQEVFMFTDSTFLDFFKLRIINGNQKKINQTPNAILLTEKTAYKLFGTVDVVGKTFTDINDFDNTKEVFTVQGVIEDFPRQSSLSRYSGVELNTTNASIGNPKRMMHYKGFCSYVKIKPATNLAMLNEKLRSYTLKFPTENNETAELKVQLQPLTKRAELFKREKYDNAGFLFFVIGTLVLLTALFNYVIFIFGRMTSRIKECGIRQVNGANSNSSFMLLFTEASIAFSMACVFSFMIAELVMPYMDNPQLNLPFESSYIYQLLVQYSLIGLACIAMLCMAVTYRMRKISVMQSLTSEKTIRRHSLLRHSFITAQLIICFLFLGATWFVRQQNQLQETRLTAGLSETDKTSIFNVSLTSDKFTPVRQEILRKLQQNPQIEIISRNAMDLFGAWQLGEGYFSWENISEQEAKTRLGYLYTDAYYFDLINQKPAKGRFYTLEETDKAVVNESFAQLINRNPIGMKIHVNYWDEGMKPYLIVGVLPDILNNKNELNTHPVLPCIYMPFPANSVNMTCIVKVKPEYRKDFPVEMKAELSKYVSLGTPIYVKNQKENAGFYISYEQNIFRLTSIFSVICVLISLLGIYASVILTTERRRKEVAIRKINGATAGSILSMFCKSNLLLLLIAAGIAFPLLAILLSYWLQNYSVRIEIEILPFIVLFLLMVIIVGTTIIWQLKQIAVINPAEVIKSE